MYFQQDIVVPATSTQNQIFPSLRGRRWYDKRFVMGWSCFFSLRKRGGRERKIGRERSEKETTDSLVLNMSHRQSSLEEVDKNNCRQKKRMRWTLIPCDDSIHPPFLRFHWKNYNPINIQSDTTEIDGLTHIQWKIMTTSMSTLWFIHSHGLYHIKTGLKSDNRYHFDAPESIVSGDLSLSLFCVTRRSFPKSKEYFVSRGDI